VSHQVAGKRILENLENLGFVEQQEDCWDLPKVPVEAPVLGLYEGRLTVLHDH
jgi:hypothetical protein